MRVRDGGGGKSEILSSTAELSDLVCYQQEISGARADYWSTIHTHAQSWVSLQPKNFTELFVFTSLFMEQAN